jgi:hypothetical protein
VDDVCCDSACDGSCEACAAALTGAADGTCDFVTRDTDPDAECAATAACNGCGACEGGQFVDSLAFGDGSDDVVGRLSFTAAEEMLLAGSFFGDLDLGGGVLPNAGDRDIFAGRLTSTGMHAWSASYGSSSPDQYGVKLLLDSDGNQILVGNFVGAIDFGGGPISNPTNPTSLDVFVVKLAANGTHIWSKRFGGDGIQTVSDAVVDGTDVILIGQYVNDIDFGTTALTGHTKFQTFVAKLDTNGDEVWAKEFTTPDLPGAGVFAGSLVVNSIGEVYATGKYKGVTDFGGGGVASVIGHDAYLVKLAANGNYTWHETAGASGEQVGFGVAVDGDGDVLWTGTLSGPMTIGTGSTLDTNGGDDVFVAKLDAGGNHLWSQSFGDTSDQIGSALAVDANDDVIIVGSSTGTVDYGGCPLAASGQDVLVLKLDTDGNHLFSRTFGDGDDQYARGVAVESSGEIVVVGNFSGDIDFGGGAHTSAGGIDIFVSRLTP